MLYEPQSLMQADICQQKWRGWRFDRIHMNMRIRPIEHSTAVTERLKAFSPDRELLWLYKALNVRGSLQA